MATTDRWTEGDEMTVEAIWAAGPPVRDAAILKEQAEAPLPPEGQERLLHDETARKQLRLESGGYADPIEGVILSEQHNELVQDWIIQHTARREQQRIARVINSPVLTAVTKALLAVEKAKEQARPAAVRLRDRVRTWRAR